MKHWKRFVVLVSVFLMFFNRFIPPVGGLNQIGMSTVCIFIGTMSLLLFVNLFWPVLLSILAFATSNIYSLSQVISMTFGHSVFNFVIFSTVMFYELRQSGVLRRLAIWLITRPIARKSPWMFIGSLWAAELLLGSVMNCTVTILLFTSLTEQIFDTVGIKKGDRTGSFIMLGLLVMCGLSYGITPIGHPTPIAGIAVFADSGWPVSFLQYSLVGYVVAVAYFVVFILTMKYLYRLDLSAFKEYDPSELKTDMGPMSKREKIGVAIFIVVALLWLLPSAIEGIFPKLYSFLSGMGTLAPVLLACIVMCLIKIDDKPMMDLNVAISEGASWTAAFPIAIAMLLSSAMTNKDAGITDFIAANLGPVFGAMPAIAYILLICFFATTLTDFSSDTVTCVLCSTISIALIQSGVIVGVNPRALCVAIGISACAAEGSPAGSTYAAITAGMGWVTRIDQFIHGSFLGIIIAIMAATIGYYFACMIM